MRRVPISREATLAGAAAFTSALLAAALGLAASAGAPESRETQGPPATPSPAAGPVEIQLLGVNDLHGHLEPPRSLPRAPGGSPIPVGGAGLLASHLDRAARSHPGRTIRVHAGDMVGASPLLSSFFHDEPTVRAMNFMDFDVGTVGNHEFDEGGDELQRLIRGGHRRDAGRFKRDARGRRVDTSARDFEGVDFPYIAANTVDREHGLRLPPTKVIERAGVKIGFIGVTTTTTPDYLLERHARRFRFLDVSDTVNRYVRRLRRDGVEAIVVLAHSGAYQERGAPAAAGEIVDEARQMSDAVDVVIAGHTHSHLNTRIRHRDGSGDKLVLEARSFGVNFDLVRMTIDRAGGEVLEKSGTTPVTWGDETRPDRDIAALIRRYSQKVAPLARRVVGSTPGPRLRGRADGEKDSLGALAARAQRRLARADIAFVNGGNARADIAAGPVTYAEAFRASALEHPLLRMDMRGADVRRVLEEQFERDPDVPLYVSGLRHEHDDDGIGDVALHGGEALDPARTYTVAANALLVERGGFEGFEAARNVRPVGTDLQALVALLRATDGGDG